MVFAFACIFYPVAQGVDTSHMNLSLTGFIPTSSRSFGCVTKPGSPPPLFLDSILNKFFHLMYFEKRPLYLDASAASVHFILSNSPSSIGGTNLAFPPVSLITLLRFRLQFPLQIFSPRSSLPLFSLLLIMLLRFKLQFPL